MFVARHITQRLTCKQFTILIEYRMSVDVKAMHVQPNRIEEHAGQLFTNSFNRAVRYAAGDLVNIGCGARREASFWGHPVEQADKGI